MNGRFQPISNLIWAGDEDLSGSPAEALLDRPSLRGHFALHGTRPDGTHVLVRDPLGVNKLFFAMTPGGGLRSSNFLGELTNQGHALGDIWSVPSDHRVEICPARQTLELRPLGSLPHGNPVDVPLETHAGRIRSRLEQVFADLRPKLEGRPIYVTMSGGLDSSVVATLARKTFGQVVGITFSLAEDRARSTGEDDLDHARRLADHLGIEFKVVEVDHDGLAELADDALLHGQDHRDFNFHCALVNVALARAISQAAPDGRPVVLTGDTMNELMNDYAPVAYRGHQFYTLPKLDPGRLRRFLVGGLDAGDREVGVFGARGIDTIQPYALAADAYLGLPPAFLSSDRAKQGLVRLVMGDSIPGHIYDRPKVRAQVGSGSEVRGTLAAMVDRGMFGPALRERFADLLGARTDDVQGLIRAGYYRFPTRYAQLALPPKLAHD